MTPRSLSSSASLYLTGQVDDEPPPQFVYVTEPYEGPLVRVERRLNTLQVFCIEWIVANISVID